MWILGQAAIARTMLRSGDWVTPRLDGIAYLDKSPLVYWAIATSFKVFGVHDWAARIPIALAAVLLCWVTARFANWAFGRREALWAGLCLSTCAGLFLFTRVLIPDILLTLWITLALWCFLRVAEAEPGGQGRGDGRPIRRLLALGALLGLGVLTKGFVSLVIPAGAIFLYLLTTRDYSPREAWNRFRPLWPLASLLLIVLPWFLLAMLRNPPLLDFTSPQRPRPISWVFLAVCDQ